MCVHMVVWPSSSTGMAGESLDVIEEQMMGVVLHETPGLLSARIGTTLTRYCG